jgi:hypothetical protein
VLRDDITGEFAPFIKDTVSTRHDEKELDIAD